jgi:hypothetical protein
MGAVLLPVSALHRLPQPTARAADPVRGPTNQPSPVPTAPSPQRTRPAAQTPVAIARPIARPVAATGRGILIDSAFDCGSPITARVLSADHVSVTIDQRGQIDVWAFRLRGVAGRTMTIDVTLPATTATGDGKYSKTITPVYGTVADLNDPAGYTTGPLDVPSTPGRQRLPIPDTRGQAWHYIADTTWVDHGGPTRGFTMTQAFTTDTVYIANRVPRPPGYNDWFIDGLAGNPLAKVIDLGRTPERRRIRAVQIGDDAGTGDKAKPCVLVAGGEQAHQPDGMWAAQGCAEFLMGDSAEAKELRDQLVFLVIPTLDPDGAAHPDFRFMDSFGMDTMYPTSIAYANWLQGRVLAGRRLDLVLELHSFQSGENEHAKLWQRSGRPAEEAAVAVTVDDAVRRQFATAGLTVNLPAHPASLRLTNRFGAWIDRHLGALYMMYAMNAQAPSGHLSLSQLKDTGRLMALATAGLIGSPEGGGLRALVDRRRAEHDTAWRDRPATGPVQNAIESERALTVASYLKHVDRANPNAATQPVDFEYRLRKAPSQRNAMDGTLPMYTRTSVRVELLGQRILRYANDHQGQLPASVGALAAGLNGPDLHDLAQDCMTPGDEQRVGLPDHPTADWIDQHTSYVFPAAGVDLNRVKGRRGQRPAQVLGATAMLYSRLDQPFFRPYDDDDEEVFVITLDGQRRVLPVDVATQLIENSKATLTAAGATAP